MSVKQMDIGLLLYYLLDGDHSYQNTNSDQWVGMGKFMEWADKNGYDSETIEEDLNYTQMLKMPSIVEFDEHFPTDKTGRDRITEMCKLLSMIWKSRRSIAIHELVPQWKLDKKAKRKGELTVYGFIRDSAHLLQDGKYIPVEMVTFIMKYYPLPNIIKASVT